MHDIIQKPTNRRFRHPKRTATRNNIINGDLKQREWNFQGKSWNCKRDRKNKDKPEVIPEVIDTIRNLPDRRYNDEADLALGIEQQQ